MANENVDRLIAELSQILEQNRQKRQQTDAAMMGAQQAQQSQRRAAQESAATAMTAGAGVGGEGRSAGRSMRSGAKALGSDDSAGFERDFAKTQEVPIGGPESSYGGDRAYSFGDNPVEFQARGHTPGDRVALAQRYAFLQDNDTPAAPPSDAGALEEQKKRFTQNLMMQRGQTGGPLGGAGQPAPAVSPETTALEKAGNPDLGNFGNIVSDTFKGGGQPAAPAAAAPPPNDDMALLEALSQRYMSPEELARR